MPLMTLRETIHNFTQMQSLRLPPEKPEGELTAIKMAELVFAKGREKGKPFLYIDAYDWKKRWLASEKFQLIRMPISAAALPCLPKDAEWVQALLHRREDVPVVVDLNKKGVGRSPSGYLPPVIVLDGKHRFRAAALRGESHILAWVGEKAVALMSGD
jgi:hypothetical protein